jgi:hypothetical protein
MRLAPKDILKLEYEGNYRRLKRGNRKKRIKLANFPNILRIKGLFEV